MSDKLGNKENKPKTDDNGCLATILFWGGLIGLFLFFGFLESENPGVGRKLFIAVIVIAAIGLFLYLIHGSTVKETSNNFATFVKWVIGIVICAIIFGPIAQCTSGTTSTSSDMYYRK